MSSITLHDKWSDPRREAERLDRLETYSGLTADQVAQTRDRFEQFIPGLASKYAAINNRSIFADSLPDGASWDPRAKTAQYTPATSGGKSLTTVQTPYQPEFASPDRQQYPVHRILANRYWRLFYKLDPVVGNCVELYSDLPWSNFELTGDGIEGEIRQAYEYMCRETQLLALLPYFVREFLVVGEVVPHTFFDNSKGVFTHVAMHNPDQLEVIDAPFIKMDPIIEFIPDDRLRSVLTSNAPALRDIRGRMPPELLSRLQSRQNIPLSPINATFIPRKLHPYDTRGTSILSRMWRVLMLEDAIFNATIQTARRHAGPIKVAKLGNAQTGWIPPPEQEKRLLELLAQAEMDPNAWLVYHYGIQFDMVGTTDKIMSINREWDIIERIKLVALGVSKSFLHGEVSYASAASGLQLFLQRLKSLRLFFEQKWLYPKFFKPIAEINGWIKPKPSEVAHRFRVKRSAQELEDQNMYIIPKIIWDKSLDPQVSTELINAMTSLEQMGVKFSKTSKMATVGYSFEEEVKKIHRENEYEKAYLPQIPADQATQGDAGGKPPPAMGGGKPPPPPNKPGDAPPGGPPGAPPPGGPGAGGGANPGAPGRVPGGAPPPTPGGASLEADKKKDKDNELGGMKLQEMDAPKPGKSSYDSLRSKCWIDDKCDNWDAREVVDLIDLMSTLESESAFWSQLGEEKEFKRALLAHDYENAWDMIVGYLEEQNYPTKDIDSLRTIMEAEGMLKAPAMLSKLQDVENGITDNAGDIEFANQVAKILKGGSNKITKEDSMLVGIGPVGPVGDLLGDIS
jgi:hypothetical protein